MDMSKPSVPRLVLTTAASQNLAINEISLYRDDLSDSERQQLAVSLQQETLNIQQKFQELITRKSAEMSSSSGCTHQAAGEVSRPNGYTHPRTDYVYQR